MQRIRVEVYQVWEYTPNLEGDFYVQHGAKSVQDAMLIDQSEFADGKVQMNELADEPMRTQTKWELFDDPTG
jgi:hypothetical protein